MFDILEADMVVMQELKIQRKDLRDDMVLIDGWDCYFSLPKQKKGWSIVVLVVVFVLPIGDLMALLVVLFVAFNLLAIVLRYQ